MRRQTADQKRKRKKTVAAVRQAKALFLRRAREYGFRGTSVHWFDKPSHVHGHTTSYACSRTLPGMGGAYPNTYQEVHDTGIVKGEIKGTWKTVAAFWRRLAAHYERLA